MFFDAAPRLLGLAHAVVQPSMRKGHSIQFAKLLSIAHSLTQALTRSWKACLLLQW